MNRRAVFHNVKCIGYSLARMYALETAHQGINTYTYWSGRLADDERKFIEDHCVCEERIDVDAPLQSRPRKRKRPGRREREARRSFRKLFATKEQ